MPLKNSRSSLNSHFADARASKILGTSLEGRVCSEAPLSRLKQPIFFQRWPAESAFVTRRAETERDPQKEQWNHKTGPCGNHRALLWSNGSTWAPWVITKEGCWQGMRATKTGAGKGRFANGDQSQDRAIHITKGFRKERLGKSTLVCLHCAHERTQPRIEPDTLTAGTSDTQKGLRSKGHLLNNYTP